jgi:hypothetical protein
MAENRIYCSVGNRQDGIDLKIQIMYEDLTEYPQHVVDSIKAEVADILDDLVKEDAV